MRTMLLNRAKTIIAVAAMLAMNNAEAQIKETPLVKIGKESISAEEFDYIYNKNNTAAQLPISKREYLDLFINYKLKVMEGKALGMDTTKQYKNESAYYFNELSKPYFTDTIAQKEAEEMLMGRLREQIDASHILISVPRGTMPTKEAYEKAVKAREEILNGADFAEVAKRVSDDPSAKQNGGRLGYFSAMMMVSEFEDMAYKSKKGDVTEIFLSEFGYHFMKIHDRRKAPGEVKAAHIMKIFPRNCTQAQMDSLKSVMDSIAIRLKDGESFEELAKRYSDDQQSGAKGGEMPWLNESKVNPNFMEFIVQTSALQNEGDISEVFKTAFGWHIAKLIGKRSEQPREELQMMIERAKQQGHPIASAGYNAIAERLLKEYGWQWNEEVKEKMANIMASQEKDSVKKAELKKIEMPLATYGKSERLMASDNSAWMHWKKTSAPYKNFSNIEKSVIMDYEKSRLTEKHADFRYTMQEYYDGLLVYEINKKMIWSKHDVDSTALMKIYEEHKARYSKGGEFTGDIIFCNKKVEKGKKKYDAYKTVSGTQKQGSIYDDCIWPLFETGYIVLKGETKQGEQLPFEQVKGQLIADYQQMIERDYIKELREKYKPKVVGKIK